MLSNISLKNVASYNEVGTKFEDLKKVNFIYGNNGTGKSTLSRAFLNIDDVAYSDCTYEGNRIEESLVYNKNFIDDNFKSDNDIPGIFTLGKDHVDKQIELDEIQRNIEKNKQDKIKAQDNLEITKRKIDESKKSFIDLIWDKKSDKTNRISELYQSAFIGLHGSKQRFYNEYCKQVLSNKSELIDIDELFKRAEVVFSEERSEVSKIPVLEIRYEPNSTIFNKSIIGKEDLEYAHLVEKLNIHTWVHEGYKTIQENNLDYCPFCRSELKEEITNYLSEYFNEKFENEIIELNKEIIKYKEYAKDVITYLERLQTLDNKYLEKGMVENILLKIQAKNEENLKHLSEKEKAPSNKIELKLFENELVELSEQINIDNEKIEIHNNTIQKLAEKKERLVRDIWKVFLNATDAEYKRFNRELNQLNGKIKGLQSSVEQKNAYIIKDQQMYEKIKASIFGISSTVIAINKQLRLYGFKNFSLKAAEDEGKYKIVRENGEDANKTLSEGEKTFITFLYYYHIVKSVENKKILFIDDPISSLDSTILYIVSTLVKDLIENSDKYKIEQLFVSTHNTYFLKEITYKISNCSYFIIRKNAKDGSYVKRYEKNPITTSYEALWKELIELKDSSANIIQNVMRRILENYFKFLGGIELDSLIKYFDEDEKIIVSSLIKWTHDGSHYIQEDLYIQQQSEMNEKYFNIFTKLFIKSGNEGHLKMMLDKCITEDIENPFKLLEKHSA
ncbi:AAA domain protein [Kurthia sp. 11kri321]|uniref:AAA family ATPase n=1 Tax=Kurthia sp. 11kri321 TaxID=1750719 RepID=UPI000745AC66|nr:AAA family ATPase [Kurthia sp. 11kri321]AMA62358.1 AAA domain protein [Kurthia sp. 11kri321]